MRKNVVVQGKRVVPLHIAAFRVIPYFARQSIPIPDHFIDIPTARLRELEETTDIDGEEDDERAKIVVEEIAEDDA
jgi:hypothetical protein